MKLRVLVIMMFVLLGVSWFMPDSEERVVTVDGKQIVITDDPILYTLQQNNPESAQTKLVEENRLGAEDTTDELTVQPESLRDKTESNYAESVDDKTIVHKEGAVVRDPVPRVEQGTSEYQELANLARELLEEGSTEVVFDWRDYAVLGQLLESGRWDFALTSNDFFDQYATVSDLVDTKVENLEADESSGRWDLDAENTVRALIGNAFPSELCSFNVLICRQRRCVGELHISAERKVANQYFNEYKTASSAHGLKSQILFMGGTNWLLDVTL